MHRAYSIILVVLLVVALAVPVFASTGDLEYNGVALPALPVEDNNPYKYITYKDGRYTLHTSPVESFYRPNGDISVRNTGGITGYSLSNGTWHRTGVTNRDSSSSSPPYYKAGTVELVWSNYDFTQDNADGSTTVFMAGTEPVVPPVICDGTSCPATDVNHDNICDDCGGVLTMSLRSSLLEYARTFAQDNDSGYSYWAIFKIADQYRVYVSETPIVSPNGVMIEGTDLKYALLYQLSSGAFSYGSWYTGFDVDELEFIEANHTIENFTAPPLAMVIQGVTGRQWKRHSRICTRR